MQMNVKNTITARKQCLLKMRMIVADSKSIWWHLFTFFQSFGQGSVLMPQLNAHSFGSTLICVKVHMLLIARPKQIIIPFNFQKFSSFPTPHSTLP